MKFHSELRDIFSLKIEKKKTYFFITFHYALSHLKCEQDTYMYLANKVFNTYNIFYLHLNSENIVFIEIGIFLNRVFAAINNNSNNKKCILPGSYSKDNILQVSFFC